MKGTLEIMLPLKRTNGSIDQETELKIKEVVYFKKLYAIKVAFSQKAVFSLASVEKTVQRFCLVHKFEFAANLISFRIKAWLAF